VFHFEKKWQASNCSLRSRRFRKAFRRFEALFAFLTAQKLGRAQKNVRKNEKYLERAENLTETLATQASQTIPV